MLNTFFRLDLAVDAGSRSSWGMSEGLESCYVCHLPAAAAGSDLTPESVVLKDDFVSRGLRLRRASGCFETGDLDLLSNREVRLGSGSVWSNLDRFEPRLSSSAILMYTI